MKHKELVVHPDYKEQLIEDINNLYNDDTYEENAEFCIDLEETVRRYVVRKESFPLEDRR